MNTEPFNKGEEPGRGEDTEVSDKRTFVDLDGEDLRREKKEISPQAYAARILYSSDLFEPGDGTDDNRRDQTNSKFVQICGLLKGFANNAESLSEVAAFLEWQKSDRLGHGNEIIGARLRKLKLAILGSGSLKVAAALGGSIRRQGMEMAKTGSFNFNPDGWREILRAGEAWEEIEKIELELLRSKQELEAAEKKWEEATRYFPRLTPEGQFVAEKAREGKFNLPVELRGDGSEVEEIKKAAEELSEASRVVAVGVARLERAREDYNLLAAEARDKLMDLKRHVIGGKKE